MAGPALVTTPSIAPSQVWARLGAEEQSQLIRLMAHLAYQVVAERPPIPRKEEPHVGIPRRPQDPLRSS